MERPDCADWNTGSTAVSVAQAHRCFRVAGLRFEFGLSDVRKRILRKKTYVKGVNMSKMNSSSKRM